METETIYQCPEHVNTYHTACAWLWHELVGCDPLKFLVNQASYCISEAVKTFMHSTNVLSTVEYTTKRGKVVRYSTENMLVDYLQNLRDEGAL